MRKWPQEETEKEKLEEPSSVTLCPGRKATGQDGRLGGNSSDLSVVLRKVWQDFHGVPSHSGLSEECSVPRNGPVSVPGPARSLAGGSHGKRVLCSSVMVDSRATRPWVNYGF